MSEENKMGTEVNSGTQSQSTNQPVNETLLAAGFTLEQINVMKEEAERKLEEKRVEAFNSKNQKRFEEEYTRIVSTPEVAPLKEVIDKVIGEHPEFKTLGEIGLKTALTVAQKEIALEQAKKNTGSTTPVDNLPRGNATKDNGSENTEVVGNLIDFKSMNLDEIESPARRDFVAIQKERLSRMG